MIEENLIPLDEIISLNDLPEDLVIIREGLSEAFSSVFIADLRSRSGASDQDTYYSFILFFFRRIGFEIGGSDGLSLVLNPDNNVESGTGIPMSFLYSWPILKFIQDFKLTNFDFSARSFYQTLISIVKPSDRVKLEGLINTFFDGPVVPDADDEEIPEAEIDYRTSVEQFIDDFNEKFTPSAPLELPMDVIDDDEDYARLLDNILQQLASNGNDFDINEVLFQGYILNDDLNSMIYGIQRLFSGFRGDFTIENIKNIITPYFSFSIENLFLALEFPRNLLKPIDETTGEVIEDENVKSQLTFTVGRLDFSSRDGFEFESALDFSFQKSQIGNTGLTLDFDNVKLDLSRNSNIPEANRDGRGNAFMGVYIGDATIGLPQRWFSSEENPETTLQLAGHDLLIGTGGISGTIALETIEPGGSVGNDDYLWVRIGGSRGFELGFNRFDMTFMQNAIVESNIRGALRIPRFTDQTTGQPLQIEVTGKLQENGDFNLTASVEGGLEAHLLNFVHFNFFTFELGRRGDDFYLGTSCDIWFEDSIMTRILGEQRISIPNLRIYSDGNIELEGGNSFIPSNVSLELGPVNMAVTGIHFGSYEQNERKYNYWGFDGAISVDPLGIDVRGEGLKYFYTVDDQSRNSFLRIQTLQVDMVIPGNASAETAMAIVHGMLTIPEPGESPEYTGEISLKLPKLNISAEAAMRLSPKDPAFLIDAKVDMTAPIPVGPLGIYGFRALLGYRYVAEKEAVGLVSGVNTWYEYYTYPPRGIHVSKFSGPNRTVNYNHPFSLGAGIVLGTNFDNGTIISTRAMMVLSLPTLFLIDGRASLLSARLGLDDANEPPFFAFIAWGDNSIEMGMGADFRLPKNDGRIVSLQAQVESRFPFNNASGWYVNLGTRENPNTAWVFKNVLNLRAQAYLMLSAQGIEAGARADFELSKKFFGIKVRIYAFAEVGGKVSFERPQLGGYVYLGGGIDVNVWRLIYVAFELSTYLSAEAVKPFLIHAELNFRGRIKITRFIRIPFSITLRLRWSVNNEVDTRPVPILPYGSDEANDNRDRTKELVRGVHMITNKSFELDYLGRNISSVNHNLIDTVIPLDTYIDIKSTKGLKGEAVSNMIGGYTMPPANYEELIPPESTSPAGREIRQVRHVYSIERMEIKAWTGSRWIDYHPYEALLEAGEQRDEVSSYKRGYWQLSSKQYDTIRLLGLTPFTYITPGEPGWFIPEVHGITPSTIFCQGEAPGFEIVDVLNKQLGLTYYYGQNAHYINGAYFRITEEENATYPVDDSDITVNTMQVTDETNHHGFAQSLTFTNHNTVLILLPEDAVEVQLKLSTRAQEVKIRYYKAYTSFDPSENQFALVSEIVKAQSDLEAPVLYLNPDVPIRRIEIEPLAPPMERIREIREEIASLFEESYESAEGMVNIGEPSDPERYEDLQEEMRRLIALSCYSPLDESCGNRIEILCELYRILVGLNCFHAVTSIEDLSTSCYAQFFTTIKDHSSLYPALISLLEPNFSYYDYVYNELLAAIPTRPLEEILEIYGRLWALADQLLEQIFTIGDCGCEEMVRCTTSFQEMRWMSFRNYEYTLLIPGSDARQEDQETMRDAIENIGQPIWRPDTKYYIHFQLKDDVNGDDGPNGINDYYYGFRTTGGVGHYAPSDPQDDSANLNLLARYIDYKRSYPNADGNLIQAKPLFWGYYECKINIFFNTPFVHHMLKDWPEYNGLGALQGSVNIKLKDPALDVLIPYPLPVELEEIVPVPHGNGEGNSIWVDVNDPSMPLELQLINEMLASTDIPCEVYIGDLIIDGTAYSVKVTNLKPRKLYTVLVYNAFSHSEVGENVEIHNFVFQTSRYENFTAQVNSCILTDGETTRQAIFDLSVDLDTASLNNAYSIVSGNNLNILPELSVKYSHPFDRVLEGIFSFKPLEYPVTTEFNVIRNDRTGDTVALLVRNPEPFNDPKTPLDTVADTIAVMNGLNIDPNFKVVYSKDYSQAIIMKSGGAINEHNLRIRFLYKLWNGSEYAIEDTVSVTIAINQ